MRRLLFCLLAITAPLAVARAETDLCRVVAREIETSLRAYKPGPDGGEAYRRISIRNAVAQNPAAGLDHGAPLDAATLARFPLNEQNRAAFAESVGRIYRAGGDKGLVLLDAIAGTAHCHTPLLFSLASGAPRAVAPPEPDDPFELCSYGGVALGAAASTPFYAWTDDDFIENDRLTIFALAGESLTKACALEVRYAIAYETAEQHCARPDLCAAFASRAAQWARILGAQSLAATKGKTAKGKIDDPALAPAPAEATADDTFPLLGAGPSRLAPQPFRFDGEASDFVLSGDKRADRLRIGVAAAGPANMAQWDAFTLAALYKAGKPVASFVVERRRGAFRSLEVRAAE